MILQADVQTDYPNHYTESAQCSGKFRGCHYVKLCGTVRNIRSIPGVKFFKCPVYGILRTGDGSHSLVRPILWKGDLEAIHTVEGITLRFSMAISGIVALIAFFLPQKMMLLFTPDQELITIGASYLRIMGITYLCWGITEVYLAILRSVGRVTVSMALNMLAFVLNVILNATFIFGLFGMPKLGATGVAIATALSRLVELVACVIVSSLSKM